MKTFLFPLRYYLDTNAVQRLGQKLRLIPNDKGVYTSRLTLMELLKRMEDEDSYKRKRGPILHLLNGGVCLDLRPMPFVIRDAFRIDYSIPVEFEYFEKALDAVVVSVNYEQFLEVLRQNGLTQTFDALKELFNKGNEVFKKGLAKYNEGGNLTNNMMIFKGRWSGTDNRKRRLYEAIKYFAEKQVENSNQPLVNLLMNYDHSIDKYMLICYYYDELRNYNRELAAHNDGFDLQHLLYLREGCRLVTDDSFFKQYVNDVCNGLAIGTEQFWLDITE